MSEEHDHKEEEQEKTEEEVSNKKREKKKSKKEIEEEYGLISNDRLSEEGRMRISEAYKKLDHKAWTKNPEAVEAINLSRRLRQTKHGLYASVPIICKAEACPYADACELQRHGIAPYGEKCPLEIAAIEDLFERYCKDLNLDPEDATQQVDLMLVKDLVDIDVAMLRCDKKMALTADMIIQNAIGTTEDGEGIYRSEIDPVSEYKEKLRANKHKTFNLLNSTRKDKVGNKITMSIDPSQQAAELLSVEQEMDEILDDEEQKKRDYYDRMNKATKENKGEIIDVEPIDWEEDDE